MKIFKKVAMLCMALTLCLSVGATVACGGKDKGGNSTSSSITDEVTQDGYSFKVVNASGAPATGYKIQLCKKAPDGTLGACLMPVSVGADGTLSYKVTDKDTAYEIHVLDANGTALKKTEYVTTGDIPANYDGGELTVTVNK